MTATSNSDIKSQSGVTEAELVKSVLSRGLATAAEIDQCRATAKKENQRGILQIMVDQQVLTLTQAKRIRQELMTPTSSTNEIPGYQLLEKLGQGSMGVVYKAKQVSMDRIVAVKILQPRLALDKEFINRFQREARLAAKLSNNHVVQAIDCGEVGGQHFFVMEYVEGRSIKEDLEQRKVFEEREALEIVLQVAQALDHAYKQHLIHRDVKPENVIITRDGTVKLADLGLARPTTDEQWAAAEEGLAIGTPYYISPEQIRGLKDIDIRTDIYSLGATLYHMVTGQVPFPADTPSEVMGMHLKQKLVPPDHLNIRLSGGVGEVVETMMAKDRAGRYAGPADLIIDLKALLDNKPPMLAREKVEGTLLANLAEGDEQADDNYDEALLELAGKATRRASLAVMLMILLLVSIVSNVLLLMKF